MKMLPIAFALLLSGCTLPLVRNLEQRLMVVEDAMGIHDCICTCPTKTEPDPEPDARAYLPHLETLGYGPAKDLRLIRMGGREK
jgi:hypothetical protein